MPWYWPFKRNDEMFDRSSLIDGISDDALLLFFIVACLIGLWIYYTRLIFSLFTFIFIFCLNRRNRATTIHPDNRQDVELLRQRTQDQGDTTSRTTSSSHSGRSRQDTCPICLNDESELTVETNCGHLFCGL
jgi:hypothetical protein